MARKLRVEYPGAIYHIMNRGDQRERIFQDDRDRLIFLNTLGEAQQMKAERIILEKLQARGWSSSNARERCPWGIRQELGSDSYIRQMAWLKLSILGR